MNVAAQPSKAIKTQTEQEYVANTFVYITTYLQGHNYPLALVQSVELQGFQLCHH